MIDKQQSLEKLSNLLGANELETLCLAIQGIMDSTSGWGVVTFSFKGHHMDTAETTISLKPAAELVKKT